ncbi:MAG: hypothetical protein JHC33_04915 [Ignisphaera sp.]|nr:hypothetical protein [Ignisphaera sp.]
MLTINQPQPQPLVVSIPKHMSMSCPFCDCEKEIRYNSFDTNTGKIESKTMSANSFQNLILNNTAQPQLRENNKPAECYCPQCYVSFSIYRCLGMY